MTKRAIFLCMANLHLSVSLCPENIEKPTSLSSMCSENIEKTTSLLQTRLEKNNADSSADAPDGWSEVLVPQAVGEDLEHLGTPGKSESQVGQDKLVQTILNCRRGGFFLDLAANDAVRLSNTLMLERDYGWTGICIEANPLYDLGLSQRQNCKVVLAAVGDGSRVTFALKDVLGGIVGDNFDNKKKAKGTTTVKMTTTPLQKILADLESPAVIDYMSLDVEGAESLVMKDFPFDTYKIRVLTVERPKPDLVDLLTTNNYRYIRRNSNFNDQTWVHQDTWDEISEQQNWSDWQLPTDEVFRASCPLPESV